ncbi:MAG: carboxypeptidase regulatory-like domain-containing protein [Caldilineaceae bacterium]|nr:carboxypeptidase regulatory-like domain-containing protein [Caldilineaceae bacterium]
MIRVNPLLLRAFCVQWLAQGRSKRLSASLLAGLVALGCALLFFRSPLLLAEDQAPDAPGSISGVVKNADGMPQAGMEVSLFQVRNFSTDNWGATHSVTTQPDGQYHFTLLLPGIYRIGVSDPQRTYAPSFYPDAATVYRAADILVMGDNRRGVDLLMQPGAQITGTITGTNNFTLTSVYVELYQAVLQPNGVVWENVYRYPSVPTAGTIFYSFTGLNASSYRVCAYNIYVMHGERECYDNVYDISQATSLTLTVGATISNVNLVLGDGSSFAQIRGQVTNQTHEPLAGIQVSAVPVPSDLFDGWRAQTDSQGNYQLTNLPGGQYKLYFTDPTGTYAFAYYRNAVIEEDARLIEVTPKQIITDVNLPLRAANQIQGDVTLFDQLVSNGYVSVEMKTPFGWRPVAGDAIGPLTGRYEISGLPEGIYRVRTSVYLALGGSSYIYEGYFGGTTPETATEIYLTSGETRVANLALSGQEHFDGSVQGRITANGRPLPGAIVSLYRRESICCYNSSVSPVVYTVTNSMGDYSITGLPTSDFYFVGVKDPQGLYATTYYSGYSTLDGSRSIRIEDTKATTDINLALPIAGAVSGRVTSRDGQPAAGLIVALYTYRPPPYSLVSGDTYTAADGRYTVKGVHGGQYYVCFSQLLSSDMECYGTSAPSSYSWLRGSMVNVTAGATTRDVDLIWGPDLQTYLPFIAR